MIVQTVYADEAISGKGSQTMRRAQYQRMLRDLDKDIFDVILIHKYDRVARNVGEHANLEMRLNQHNVRLIAVSQDFGQSKEAKMMRTIMWGFSEYYIDNLADEVKKGHQETALKGLHNGGVPHFGCDVVNQHYVKNELEAYYLQRMFDAVEQGLGFTDLIKEMEAAGIKGKRGKPIRYTQIYEILRNEKCTGVLLYSPVEEQNRADRRRKPNAIRVEGALPVLIKKEQFDAVQKILNSRKHCGRRADYLCSGLVFCQCGAKMHGMVSKRKGYEYPYFCCSKHCGAPVVRMKEVDNAALQYLRDLLSDDNQERIAKALREYQAGTGNQMEEFKAALQRRIKEKQGQYDALLANLSSGVLPPAIIADVAAQMENVKNEIITLQQTEPPKDITVDYIKNWLQSLKDNPDVKAIRMLIALINVIRENENTTFDIQSTLNAVLGNLGCGGWI